MTIVTMPDGVNVDFEDLPPDQIKALIVKKFPFLAPGGQGEVSGAPDVAATMQGASAALQPPPGPAAGWVDKLAAAVGAPTSSDVVAGNYDNNFGGALNQAATFGLSAGSAGLAKAMGGGAGIARSPEAGTFGEALLKGEAASRAGTAQYAQEHPVANVAANVLGSVGSMGPSGTVPAVPLTTKQLLAQGAKAGATAGGIGGFGYGEGGIPERLTSAGKGAVVGGALGTAMAAATLPFSRKAGTVAAAMGPEDLKAAGNAKFAAAMKEGVIIEPKSFAKAVNTIDDSVYQLAIDVDNTPKSWAAMNKLKDFAASGVAPDIIDLKRLNKSISNAISEAKPGGNDQMIAYTIRNKFNDFLTTLEPSDVIASDPKKAIQLIGEGNALWRQYKNADKIDQLFQAAKLNSQAYSQAGMENAVRQQFKALAERIIKNSPDTRFFNAAEKAAIIKAGGNLGLVNSVLRWAGKAAPTGGASQMFQLILGYMTSGASLPLTGASLGARALAERGRMKAARAAEDLIRRGGVAAPVMPSAITGKAQLLGRPATRALLPYLLPTTTGQ